MKRQRRKLIVYRTMGNLDYFEYYYDGVWKNQKHCEAWLAKHPDYQPASIQVIRSSRKARNRDWQNYHRYEKPMTVAEIVEYCEMKKKSDRESKPATIKDEKDYTYNREAAEEWMALAKENGWDLNQSIKPLCEQLGLAPVVIAPVLQRYGFIEKKKPTEKVYKYNKEQVEVWWNDKIRDGLTIQQLADRVGVHFLQLGRAFTQYGFQPKKEKKEKGKRGRKRKNQEE